MSRASSLSLQLPPKVEPDVPAADNDFVRLHLDGKVATRQKKTRIENCFGQIFLLVDVVVEARG
jgi:hypothetical protein